MRARRLVVDTGLHAKRWTRQQAIDYGIEASEVERYTVYPGQACSYMIGELKILELRDKAQKALGNRFALREFHNIVLRAGSVPFAGLGKPGGRLRRCKDVEKQCCCPSSMRRFPPAWFSARDRSKSFRRKSTN